MHSLLLIFFLANVIWPCATAPNRTILITGSTDGIGKETALELARNQNNFIIVHGRDTKRCRDTVEAIKRNTSNNNIDFVVADFASMQAVSNLAGEVQRRFPRLNVLVNNAGVALPKRQVSQDGLEMTFQVNHLAPFLLTNRLSPLLKQNRPSRVVVVSSSTYSGYHIDWSDLMAEKQYDGWRQYSRSKTMNHLFAFALARRFANDRTITKGSMTCNVLEPGYVSTKLTNGGGGSVQHGAATSVYLAQSPNIEGVNGEFYNSEKRKVNAISYTREEAEQEKLWQKSQDIINNLKVL